MITCKNCKSEVDDSRDVCGMCQYPVKGTAEQQAAFIARQVIQRSDVEESIKRLRNSRIILFVLGVFYILVPFTPLSPAPFNYFTFGFNAFLGLIFIGFGLLTFKMPKIALAIPLGMVVLYYLILLLINPVLLWSGILWKMIVLLGLWYGFFSVRKSDKALRENPYLASLLGFQKIKNV